MGEFEQIRVGLPIGTALIVKRKANLLGSDTSDDWLQEEVLRWVGDKPENRHDWPGKYYRLFAGKLGDVSHHRVKRAASGRFRREDRGVRVRTIARRKSFGARLSRPFSQTENSKFVRDST